MKVPVQKTSIGGCPARQKGDLVSTIGQQERAAPAFRLILRYSLDPGNAPREHERQLLKFVEESGVEEIMFLIAPEERSCGHITPQEATPWIEEIRRITPLLAARGVAISLNPWSTLYHSSRGRRLHPGQDFRRMVGENGVASTMSPCPWCQAWRTYQADYFLRLARELKPTAIWIEDDWRLHNHGEELGFGGCYCADCMARFSATVGEEVDRQGLLSKVLRPGVPHPWRKLWLDQCRQAILEPAADVARRVWSGAADLRFGLMVSMPDVHSAEGRDWSALIDAWSKEQRIMVRPHMPPYTETPPISTFSGISRQTVCCCAPHGIFYPELENSPRCGQYSGSHAYTKWKVERGLMYGAAGITINHFDNTGMSTWYDPGLGAELGRERARWNAVAALHLDERRARGVQVLFSPDVARHRHTAAGQSMQELANDSVGWSDVFYVLGVSHGFVTAVGDDPSTIYAVSDQTLRAFGDQEINRLLRRGVLLDLPSTEILVERGFGELIGVRSVRRTKLEEAAYSIEEVDTAFFDEPVAPLRPRMCAQRNAMEIGIFDPLPQARTASTLLRADVSPLAPATLVFTNDLGGTVISTCYPLKSAQFFMAYFNRVRQVFFRNLLARLHRDDSGLTIASGHPLQVHALNLEQGIFIGVTNVIFDVAERYSLHLPTADLAGRTWQRLDGQGNWRKQPVTVMDEGAFSRIQIEEPLPVLTTEFLLLR